MKEELIFHLVKKSEWNEAQQDGEYKPQNDESQEYIPLSTGSNVESVANEKFKGTDDLLLLVIDPSRVNAKVSYGDESDEKRNHPHIQGTLNKDAVIDKIPLAADENGNFEIEVESD